MTSKTSKCVITAAAAAAIFAMAGVVRADDGGDGGELLPIVFVGGDEAAAPASCAEQRELAKFIVEMKRTDGDVSPTATAITCRDELYAQSTVDAD